MNETLLAIALIALTGASAFCSGSEVALFSLSQHKVYGFRHHADRRRQVIARLLTQPRDLLVTVFMLNTLVNILLQNAASSLFAATNSWLYKVGVPLVLTLLVGEVLPKYFSLKYNLSVALWTAPLVDLLQRLMAPLRRLTIALTQPVSRLLFFFLRREEEMTNEEILHTLTIAKEQKVLNAEEAELIEGFVTLLDKDVSDCMRPREDILFWDINSPLRSLEELFTVRRCSRVPVCHGGLDNILGIINVTSYFQHHPHIKVPSKVRRYLKKALYVPEQTTARSLLQRFYRSDEQMALVVDEYGTVSGLVTLEDLAEEVIGEVSDLRDPQAPYTMGGDNEVIANGKMELDDLNELLDAHLTSDYMNTIGGWLMEQLDGIPMAGAKYESQGLLFHVLAATPKRVLRVYIRKLPTVRPSRREAGP